MATHSIDTQGHDSARQRALVRVFPVLKLAVGKGEEVRAHERSLVELGDLPLLCSARLGGRVLRLERALDELERRLADALVEGNLSIGCLVENLLLEDIHVGKGDGIGVRDHGEGVGRLELRLVPAWESSPGRGRFKLSESVGGWFRGFVGVGRGVVTLDWRIDMRGFGNMERSQ